jgi:hypothetical protein
MNEDHHNVDYVKYLNKYRRGQNEWIKQNEGDNFDFLRWKNIQINVIRKKLL